MKSHRQSSTHSSFFKMLSLFILALGLSLAGTVAAAKSPQNNSPQNSSPQNNDKTDKQAPSKAKDGSNKGFGLILSGDATSKDVGLPVYPGAQRSKETSDESSALQMGAWGGGSGFKLALLKLDSGDSPEKIAGFYRKALAKYGPVLDCGKADAKRSKNPGDSNALDCESDQPAAGGFTLKSGTKDKQHVVAIEPDGGHSKIALVYVESPKSGSKQN